MPMKLVLLGSTGYHPTESRHTACLMLPELGIVLDAGTGMFRVRERVVTDELDIFLTHAHLDHVVGLTYLFDTTYDQTLRRLTVHAEPEKIAALREHLFYPLLFPVMPPFTLAELGAEAALAGGGRLTSFPLKHPGGSLGFRLDWPGHSMAYVTDTTAQADATYIKQIQGVDLLVHECYFADEHRDHAVLTGHSCTSDVAEVARAARVGQLVLVHLNPFDNREDPIGLDIAQRIFPNTALGFDLAEWEF